MQTKENIKQMFSLDLISDQSYKAKPFAYFELLDRFKCNYIFV